MFWGLENRPNFRIVFRPSNRGRFPASILPPLSGLILKPFSVLEIRTVFCCFLLRINTKGRKADPISWSFSVFKIKPESGFKIEAGKRSHFQSRKKPPKFSRVSGPGTRREGAKTERGNKRMSFPRIGMLGFQNHYEHAVWQSWNYASALCN